MAGGAAVFFGDSQGEAAALRGLLATLAARLPRRRLALLGHVGDLVLHAAAQEEWDAGALAPLAASLSRSGSQAGARGVEEEARGQRGWRARRRRY